MGTTHPYFFNQLKKYYIRVSEKQFVTHLDDSFKKYI